MNEHDELTRIAPRETIKPFLRQGRQITIDVVLVDELMPHISANAWRVLCFFIRKTQCFGKDADYISYSQIRKGAGIASDKTVSLALHELMGEERCSDSDGRLIAWLPIEGREPLIFCKQGERIGNKQRETNYYTLNLDFTI